MTTCPVCRAEVQTEHRFCSHCGADMTGVAIQIVALDPARMDPSTRPGADDAGPTTINRLALGLVGVLCLALVGVVVSSQLADEEVPVSGSSAQEESLRFGSELAGPVDSDAADGGSAQTRTPPDAFVGVAPDGHTETSLTGPLQTWDGDELLVIVASPTVVYALDLASGQVDEWTTPEPLAMESPVGLPGMIVLVGETRAWARAIDSAFPVGSQWIDLGPANRARPSTKTGRVWLRTLNNKEAPTDAPYLWSEVDQFATVHRTMLRNRDIHFSTPEIVAGLGGDMFRMTEETDRPWRLLSPYGTPVAVGVNDLVSFECTVSLKCRRVWYDLRTAEVASPLFNDLANNIDLRFGGVLSLDGRYVSSEGVDGGVNVVNVATNNSISNTCRWEEPVSWTTRSELFGCMTTNGLQLYDTASGDSLGLAKVGPGTAYFTFVPIPVLT